MESVMVVVAGRPGWIDSDRFDVEGKAEDPRADFDQLRLMLRSALADRFKLKVHGEIKESSIYALVAGSGGPRIKLSSDQVSPDVNGAAPPGAGPQRGATRMGAGSLSGNAITLSSFATRLSQRLDRLVVDRTNLAGRFDIQLQWAPSEGENPFGPGGNKFPAAIIDMNGMTVTADPSGPSIFSAIQQQLGLRLESDRAAVDVLVIDRVDKPSEN